jgi:hypothetical protein
MKKSISVLALTLCASSVFANQFVLTTSETSSGKGASSQSFALDLLSNGDGTTLVVKVAIPDADKASVDLSACGRGLPQSFEARCSLAKGNVIMLVYNDVNALLPKGTVSLGTFNVKYSDGVARKFSVASTEVVSPSAKEIPSSVATPSVATK